MSANHNTMHPLVEIFNVANELLGTGKYNLGEVDDRTLRRWFNEGATPSDASARIGGSRLWELLADSRRESAHGEVMAAIREHFPEANPEGWKTAEAFGVWCARQVQPQPPPSSLTLETRLLIHDSACGFVELTDEHLPVRAKQRLRIEVTPSRACHLYLCWVNPDGRAVPLFPWQPGNWDTPEADEDVPGTVRLPANQTAGFPVEAVPGLQTLVALAREEPFPTNELPELRDRLSGAPTEGGRRGRSRGRAVLPTGLHAYDLPLASAALTERIIPVAEEVDDPVSARHRELAARLAGRYDAGRCVTFANAGKP